MFLKRVIQQSATTERDVFEPYYTTVSNYRGMFLNRIIQQSVTTERDVFEPYYMYHSQQLHRGMVLNRNYSEKCFEPFYISQ
jgi:hypothetical protein